MAREPVREPAKRHLDAYSRIVNMARARSSVRITPRRRWTARARSTSPSGCRVTTSPSRGGTSSPAASAVLRQQGPGVSRRGPVEVRPETASRALQIESKELDTLNGPAPQDIERLQGNADLVVTEVGEQSVWYSGSTSSGSGSTTSSAAGGLTGAGPELDRREARVRPREAGVRPDPRVTRTSTRASSSSTRSISTPKELMTARAGSPAGRRPREGRQAVRVRPRLHQRVLLEPAGGGRSRRSSAGRDGRQGRGVRPRDQFAKIGKGVDSFTFKYRWPNSYDVYIVADAKSASRSRTGSGRTCPRSTPRTRIPERRDAEEPSPPAVRDSSPARSCCRSCPSSLPRTAGCTRRRSETTCRSRSTSTPTTKTSGSISSGRAATRGERQAHNCAPRSPSTSPPLMRCYIHTCSTRCP